MKLGNHKLFANKRRLYLLVNLRISGYASSSLALLFGCDRNSIEKQLEKYNIIPLTESNRKDGRRQVFTIERIVSDILARMLLLERAEKIQNGERINRGKSYKEYLAEAYPPSGKRPFYS